MTNVARFEVGKYTCDIEHLYEKVSDNELKMTLTIDDQFAVYQYKNVINKKTITSNFPHVDSCFGK